MVDVTNAFDDLLAYNKALEAENKKLREALGIAAHNFDNVVGYLLVAEVQVAGELAKKAADLARAALKDNGERE